LKLSGRCDQIPLAPSKAHQPLAISIKKTLILTRQSLIVTNNAFRQTREHREATMSSKQLVETALRVLVAWSNRRTPDPADVLVLKAESPTSFQLPADELACEVINGLIAKPLPEAAPGTSDRGR
jgi:hypothetical protein